MDRLNAMRTFAAVADSGSFAAAARQLRLSPAAVTRAVAQLEQQLGLLLLNRTTRSVRLTPPGAVYVERCRQILADLAEADRLTRGETAAPHGRLTIAAPLTFGRLHVLPVVNALLRQHPALSVRLLLSDRIVHLAEDGVDVAVRIGKPADSALVAVRLGTVRRILTASPDYIGRHGTPDSPAALAGHAIIVFAGGDATDEWQFGTQSIRLAPRLIVTSADAAIDAASAGLGITRTLSYQAQAALHAGRLHTLLDAFAPPPIPVNLVYPAHRTGSPNVAAFVKAARAALRASTDLANSDAA